MSVHVAPLSSRVSPDQKVSWVVSREGDGTVVAVEGELDFGSAAIFAAALVAVGAGSCDAIVDMARVDAIDATALGALVCVHRLFEILGLALTIRAPSHPVRRVLRVCQLENLISTI
jgi:anti-anti-sigma factor